LSYGGGRMRSGEHQLECHLSVEPKLTRTVDDTHAAAT
jgi:hypothetical protein